MPVEAGNEITTLARPAASAPEGSVAALADRIALRSGEPLRAVQARLDRIGAIFSPGALAKVAAGAFQDHELEISVVRQRVRRIVNARRPDMQWCTGGTSALEIAPNGSYSRCPKFSTLGRYQGNLRDDGPIRLLDPGADDMSCSVPCPKMMCFTRNVLRAPTPAGLDAMIGRRGIAGLYAPSQHARPAIFIRWKMTDVCNYTCSYCTDWRTVNKRGQELTDEEMLGAARRMFDQFDRISLRLTGGEPSARRCYVELMRLVHERLDRFTDIEIRTNLSFHQKHREVLGWNWRGKLRLHVGCHVRDKGFMPWRMVEVVKMPGADYVLKFVATPGLRPHVAFFRDYFLKQGVPANRIHIVEEVTDKELAGDAAPEEVPVARRMMEAGPASAAAEGAPPPRRVVRFASPPAPP